MNRLGKFALHVVERHITHGGSSTNIATGQGPKGGYMVAVTPADVVPGRTINWGQVEHYLTCADPLKDFRRTHNLHNAYLGTWYDENTDESYIEVSVRVETLTEALELAAKHSQLAVYDVAGQRSLYLNVAGHRLRSMYLNAGHHLVA